jgi:lysophospholipase L1-like esterase
MSALFGGTILRTRCVYLLLLVSAIVLSLTAPCGHADEIIAFGDSITKGTPYVKEKEGNGRRVGGYEPVLEDFLNSAGRSSFVYNWGIGGENSLQGLFRIDDVIDSYNQLDYALIMEGTNDFGQMSVSSTIFNLLRMVERCRNRNVEPLIATLTPDTGHGTEKRDLIKEEYNPQIKSMTAASQVTLVDQYQATVNNWSGLNYDGTHPNTAGYQVLAQTWGNAVLQGASHLRPIVKTLDASSVGKNTAVLNGSVNPNQSKTTYYFEFGLTSHYTNTTDSFDAGDGGSLIAVSVNITNLEKDKTYHCRIVAKNEHGTASGQDRAFVTNGILVNTLEASHVGRKSAKLNGVLDPEGYPTQYYFAYGTTTSYGTTTGIKDAGSEAGQISVSEDITDLQENMTYHFRLVSIRNNNETFGNDMTFSTNADSGGSGSGCFILSVLLNS